MTNKPRYRVEVDPAVVKELRRLPRDVVRRVSTAIEGLAVEPRPRGTKKLTGEDDLYRLRVGEWRLIYSIEDRVLTVWVLELGHRRDIYR